jgi:ABC-type nitrate/sulfonate/bicarbonate transport system permease component
MARLAKHRRVTLPALRLASVIGFFVAWEMMSRSGLFSPFLLPAPTTILDYLWSDFVSGQLVTNLRLTLGRMFAGYCIAAVIGVSLGIAIARVALVRWFFDPLISIGLPMPQVAFLPIFILWLQRLFVGGEHRPEVVFGDGKIENVIGCRNRDEQPGIS